MILTNKNITCSTSLNFKFSDQHMFMMVHKSIRNKQLTTVPRRTTNTTFFCGDHKMYDIEQSFTSFRTRFKDIRIKKCDNFKCFTDTY